MTTFTIEGGAIRDIATLYDELNRVFMTGEDWRLGESLDALDDMLRGGYGALAGTHGIRVVWNGHAASRRALGREATAEYYRRKLRHPEIFDEGRFRRALADLPTGPTYYDIVREIFAAHPEIELILN